MTPADNTGTSLKSESSEPRMIEHAAHIPDVGSSLSSKKPIDMAASEVTSENVRLNLKMLLEWAKKKKSAPVPTSLVAVPPVSASPVFAPLATPSVSTYVVTARFSYVEC